MTFTVLAQELVPVLNNLVSTKQIVNFTIVGDELKIQSFEPIINNVTLKLTKLNDSTGNNTISFQLDGSFNLLEPGEVVFHIDEDSLLIATPDYRSRFASVYEERFENAGKVVEHVEVYVNAFPHISRISQGISNIARSIGVDSPAVVFKNGKAYMVLSNLMWCLDAKFYDCILPVTHLRALNRSLTKVKYDMELYGEERNYAGVKYTENADLCFPIRRDNSETIATIEGIIAGLKKAGESTLVSLENQIKIVEKIYKNEPITAYVGEGGFRVEISQGTSSFLSIGKQTTVNMLATLRTSVPVLSLIYRIFGDAVFEVYTGGRYVCLKKGKECLLLTGLQ